MKEKSNQSVQILSDESLSEIAGGISDEAAKEILMGISVGVPIGIGLGLLIKYVIIPKIIKAKKQQAYHIQ